MSYRHALLAPFLMAGLTGLVGCCGSSPQAVKKDEIAAGRRAILVAMPRAADHGVFNKAVVIQCVQVQPSGFVVRFSRETSVEIASAGRIPTKTLCEIPVTRGATGKMPAFGPIKSKQGRLARAASAACSYLFNEGNLDLEFRISVKESQEGYDVGIFRIPYTPGASAGVALTREYKVTHVFRGE